MASNRNVYIVFVLLALGGLLFGFIIGVNSNVVTTGQLLCADGWTGVVGDWSSVGYEQCYNLGPWSEGFLTSLNLIGACLASLFCFRFADDMGRRREVQVGAAMYAIGALLAALSPVLWGVYLGLAIYGVGIGFAMHAAPVYIAEISPAAIRGTLVSAKEAFVVFGMFMGFFFGYIFSSTETYGWRFMMGIPVPVALIVGIGITMVPESPRFLVLKSTSAGLLAQETLMRQARVALQFYRSQEDVGTELGEMTGDITAAQTGGAAKWNDAFRYRQQLVVGCGIVFLQQVTGQPSVLYFATNIFKDAGFGSAAALSSVGVGFVKLVATMFTVFRVDQYGRRVLLFVGISMMTAALAVLSLAFVYQYCETPDVSTSACDQENLALPHGWSIATVVALCVYVSGYQVGFGPIAWVLISEVFPQGVRGSAMSLAAMTNFASNIAMTLTLVPLQKALTPAGNFLMYFVLSIVSLLFVAWKVPETKGKTLEQIELAFENTALPK